VRILMIPVVLGLCGGAVVGTAGPASAVAPPEPGEVRPLADAGTPAARPDLAGLKLALRRTVTAGAPGAWARLHDGERDPRTFTAGVSDQVTGTPADARDRYRIGSASKMFATVVALQLVGEGKLSLDEQVHTYLPELFPAKRRVTVRHLLSHRSGLHDYTAEMLRGPIEETYERIRYQTFTPEHLLGLTVKEPQSAPPGTRFEYSNPNFVAVGMLIERVTGRPYADELQARVLDPLGLTETSFTPPHRTMPRPHARGYMPLSKPAKSGERLIDATEQSLSYLWVAGGVTSTARDMDRFLTGLVAGRLLTPALLAEMTTTRPDAPGSATSYGLGLRERRLSCGVSVIGHTGIIQGYQNYSFITRDGQRRLILATNVSNNTAARAQLGLGLDAVFCGRLPTGATTAEATHRAVSDS
jgi:D-alanyl-D-alanine carboxypeptidase